MRRRAEVAGPATAIKPDCPRRLGSVLLQVFTCLQIRQIMHRQTPLGTCFACFDNGTCPNRHARSRKQPGIPRHAKSKGIKGEVLRTKLSVETCFGARSSRMPNGAWKDANTRIKLEAAKGLHVLQTSENRLPKLSSRKRRQSRTEGKMVSFSTGHMPQTKTHRVDSLCIHCRPFSAELH